MNKLTKLSIKKFRNVAPTTLEFSPGLNVLLGKNAAGKTTLLRLLSVAAGMLDEALKDDELDISYRAISGPAFSFEHAIKRTRVAEPTLDIDPSRPVRQEFQGLQQDDSFTLEQNGVVVTRAEVLPNEVSLEYAGKQHRVERPVTAPAIPALFLALRKSARGSLEARLAETLLSARVEGAKRLDESLERFNDLLEFEIRIDSSGFVIKGNLNDIPHSMFDNIHLHAIPEGTSTNFSLVFLDRVARVLDYNSASVRFDIERLSPDPSRPSMRLSNLRFFFKRPGEEISHDLLSYGQKRLLAFYAHVDASPNVVIADELVNGLHHDWIQACLNEIGDRQAFLTSQNPLLLDFLRFNDVEHVRRTFILCERVVGEAGAQLVWRNPTMEEAESFFSAYETGIQRISDILLTKGLW